MAIIGSIRKRSGLLIGLVGLAMVLFILGDLLGSGQLLFNNQQQNVGEIDGTPISYQEFETRVERSISQRYQNQSVNAEIREQVRSMVWNEVQNENIMFPQYGKLGISITGDELMYTVQNDADRTVLRNFFSQQGQVLPQFQNQVTGGLDGNKIIQFLKSSDLSEEGGTSWFLPMQRALKSSLLDQKYFAAITNGVYRTSAEVQVSLQEQSRKVDVSYVVRRYSEIADADVQYTDAELKAYYEEHKNLPAYEQKTTTRNVEFISFPFDPSDEDIETARQDMLRVKESFERAEDDTAYVVSDRNPLSTIKELAAGDVPAEMDSVIRSAEKDAVFGPYREAESFELAKVVRVRNSPDSVKARHIVLLWGENDSSIVRNKLDSIMQVVKSKKNFSEMAAEFSQDPETSTKGGERDWKVERESYSAEYNKFCFDGQTGDMGIVESQVGLHLVEVMDQTKPKRRTITAFINHKITPGDRTISIAYDKANVFSIENKTAEGFAAAAKEEGYDAQEVREVPQSGSLLNGIPGSKRAVSWTYRNEVGTVSEPLQADGRFIVVAVNSVNEKGVKSFEAVKDQVITAVIQEKKAEKLIAEMSGQASLEAVASSLGVTVQQAPGVTFAASSTPLGFGEYAVAGTACALQQGEMSQPVKGNSGVFVVRADRVNEFDMNQIPSQIGLQGNSLDPRQIRSVVTQELIDQADVQDFRYEFY